MKDSELKEQIKKLPAKSGIYIFKNERNKPLYIGKALNLKNRIKNYPGTDHPRLRQMINESVKVGFIETDSEIEALILESQYIKKYRPDFNIMLRDDKQYFYVGFTDEKFPKIFLTHQPQHHNEQRVGSGKAATARLVLGPFTDGSALKTTLRLLRKIFPYCTCKQTHHSYCLNYHIGKCPGFCCLKKHETGNTKQETKIYEKNIRAIKDILSGKKSSLIKNLEKEMRGLSKRQEYEKARELQFKIERLKRVFENATIIQNYKLKIKNSDADKDMSITLQQLKQLLNITGPLHRIEAYDIANIQGKHASGSMVVFTNGRPDKNEYRKFNIIFTDQANDTAMLQEIIVRRFRHPEWPSPDLIIVDGGKAQLNSAKILVKNIPIIALTKNEKHLGHKITMADREIELSKLPLPLKNLLLEIDGEAHRFAINQYRKLHRRKMNPRG